MNKPLTAATPDTDVLDAIRAQVLRGIALNREPGYHFAGNFLDLSYDHVGTDYTALSVDVAPHCAEADAQLSLSGFAILADLVTAAAVRAGLPPHTRLATVTMNLQFTGVPRTGRLSGRGAMHGFVEGAAGTPLNPVAFVTIESDRGQRADYRLIAFDRERATADGGLLRLASIADVVMRVRAVDFPSQCALHYAGLASGKITGT
jgi:hypothetical protein